MASTLINSARMRLGRYFGPSTLVTAAFIGPGTVTVCTLAGVNSGYSLLWALLFSVLATLVLQEMSARLGLITGQGFAEAIRGEIRQPVLRMLCMGLVLAAIVIGNATYEGGNIAGAALGFEELLFNIRLELGFASLSLSPLLIGYIAFLILRSSHTKFIERSLLLLVAVMSLVFVTTAVLVKPDVPAIIRGLFIPTATASQWLTVIALIGTTVVPYNLFLHAALVSAKYQHAEQLRDLRLETVTAVFIGGVISISIVITSAATLYGASSINSAADMAVQLGPLLGDWSGPFLGLGLFAAGISSAITAPLAAAYAARGILGWQASLADERMRLVWQGILAIGVAVASLGISPVLIIQFAQIANGILLPVIAGLLLVLMNRTGLLGAQVNSLWLNMMAGTVVVITLILGARSIGSALGLL